MLYGMESKISCTRPTYLFMGSELRNLHKLLAHTNILRSC